MIFLSHFSSTSLPLARTKPKMVAKFQAGRLELVTLVSPSSIAPSFFLNFFLSDLINWLSKYKKYRSVMTELRSERLDEKKENVEYSPNSEPQNP